MFFHENWMLTGSVFCIYCLRLYGNGLSQQKKMLYIKFLLAVPTLPFWNGLRCRKWAQTGCKIDIFRHYYPIFRPPLQVMCNSGKRWYCFRRNRHIDTWFAFHMSTANRPRPKHDIVFFAHRPVHWHPFFTPQPSRLEGYCRHGPGGRADWRLGGRLPDLWNPYLCNRMKDFLRSKFYGIV